MQLNAVICYFMRTSTAASKTEYLLARVAGLCSQHTAALARLRLPHSDSLFLSGLHVLYLVLSQIERQAAGVCRLKLGDFGLAMVVTEPVFTICGTPTYVAPEILCETGRCILPLWKE